MAWPPEVKAAIRWRGGWLKTARPAQLLPEDHDWNILLWIAGRGFGKVLCLKTPLPTPSGWTTMGDIQVGDTVFDESGRQTTVTFVSDIQSEPCYRMKFSDGSELVTGLSHQWVTWTHAARKALLRSPYEDHTRFPDEWPAWRSLRTTKWDKTPHVTAESNGPQVRTTAEIISSFNHGKRGDLNHCIPNCGALRLPDVVLPVAPYTLGYWLGNGHHKGAIFTCHLLDGNHVAEMLHFDGYKVRSFTRDSKGGQALIIRCDGMNARPGPGRKAADGTLLYDLRASGVFGNKHVPSVYMRASIRQRLALLRGLMDSDGGVDFANSCSFTNTNQGLVEAVGELAISLGCRVSYDDRIPICQTGPGLRAYRVSFTPVIQPFSLKRKAELLAFDGAQALRRHHRMIVSIERCEDVPLRCISVDGRHSMYLAGTGMIPTHNSKSLTEAGCWEAWRVPKLIVHYLAATSSDVRGTILEGPAGVMSVLPKELIADYNRSLHEVKLINGSLLRGFSTTEEGERLRGPQCHLLLGDELCAWDRPAGNMKTAFTTAMLGCRLPYPDGSPTRALFGTTPKPIPFLKELMARKNVRVVRGTTYDNLANLSGNFRDEILQYAGTTIGRQEIDGEIIDIEEMGIFKRSWFKLWPANKKVPVFTYVVESYDTAFSEHNFDAKKQESDPTGCCVFGVFNMKAAFSDLERKKMGLRSPYGVLLCDAWNERLSFPELAERAHRQHRLKWGSPGRPSDVVLIEDKGSGISLRQMLVQYGVPTQKYNPGKQSKTQRAHAVSPIVAQGIVFIPETKDPERKGQPRNWAMPFLDQVCAFAGPGSVEHDEMIDCLGQALQLLKDRGMLTVEPMKAPPLDPEEQRLKDEAEAVKQAAKQRPRVNPYAE